jgi:hypothetical protein
MNLSEVKMLVALTETCRANFNIAYFGSVEQCLSTAGSRTVPGPGINYTGPREVNILYWKYSEENNIRECVVKLRPRMSK